MRKLKTQSAAFVLICCAVFCACIRIGTDLSLPTERKTTEVFRADSAAVDKCYIIKSRDGKICVFPPENSGEDIITTEISLAGLREADRSLFEKGIRVDSREELLNVLEDFSS